MIIFLSLDLNFRDDSKMKSRDLFSVRWSDLTKAPENFNSSRPALFKQLANIN